jgi:hypothetical protein
MIAYEGKHGIRYWLADTEEQLCAALKLLFELLDDLGCFSSLDDDLPAARKGDQKAIRRILRTRQVNETWEVCYAIDPLAK